MAAVKINAVRSRAVETGRCERRVDTFGNVASRPTPRGPPPRRVASVSVPVGSSRGFAAAAWLPDAAPDKRPHDARSLPTARRLPVGITDDGIERPKRPPKNATAAPHVGAKRQTGHRNTDQGRETESAPAARRGQNRVVEARGARTRPPCIPLTRQDRGRPHHCSVRELLEGRRNLIVESQNSCPEPIITKSMIEIWGGRFSLRHSTSEVDQRTSLWFTTTDGRTTARARRHHYHQSQPTLGVVYVAVYAVGA